MARIRTVKPGLFKNEELAELPVTARLLFVGLFCLADKEGRLEDRPKRIKAEIYPYDNIDVSDLLSRLQSAGFIKRYEVGELKLIQVINFKKHQRITGSELQTDSTLPAQGNTEETLSNHSGNTLETPRTTGREGKGKEGNKEGKGYTPHPEMELPEIDIGKAIEYVTLTKQVTATREIILSLWTVFKTKNFGREKFYKDESDVRGHFFNALKFEKIDATVKRITSGSAAKPGTSEARIAAAKNW